MDKQILTEDNFNFKEAFEESLKSYQENSIIKAKVEQVTSDTVFLNFGYKAEAKLSTSEFDVLPKVGDEVELYLVRLEGRGGEPIVSKKIVENIKDRAELKKIKKEDRPVKGKVISVEKGGAFVSYNSLKGFIPVSIFDLSNVNLEDFNGREITFYIDRVVDFNSGNDKKRGPKEDFIGNRKRYLLDKKDHNRELFFTEKRAGDTVEGHVKNITDFGVFIDVEGVDVLVRKKDISWYRFNDINELLKVGQKVSAILLTLNKDKKLCTASIKRLQEDPWNKFIKQHKEGDVVVGSVVSLMTYGAFVKIIDGVEGLLHISDMSWLKNVNNPAEIVKVGQNVELKIIKIDYENKRINLSLKHLLDNPWDKVKDKYKVGTKIKGKIKDITSFGCFIELEQGIDALLHIDDVSWTENVRNLNEYFKVGDEVEAVVISCETEKNKIKVGIKQLTDDPWALVKDRCKKGDAIMVKIVDIDDEKGLFVEVVENLKVLIPLNHISLTKRYDVSNSLKNDFAVGNSVEVLVTMLDIRNRKISLSIKELLKIRERESIKEFLHDKGDEVYTLSDTIKDKK